MLVDLLDVRRVLRVLLVVCLPGLMAVTAGCGDDQGSVDGLEQSCPGDNDSEVCQVFRLVNEERADAGLEPYQWDSRLAEAAQLHAIDMVENGYFSHDSQDGRNFAERAVQAGYEGGPRGENIAAGQRSAEQVMNSWMNSSGHRANILSSGSNEIGIGFHENHWVQVFGRDNSDQEKP